MDVAILWKSFMYEKDLGTGRKRHFKLPASGRMTPPTHLHSIREFTQERRQ
jgi:hypothetical protein